LELKTLRASTHADRADSTSANNGSISGYETEAGSPSAGNPTVDGDEGSRNYCFSPLTVTVSRIREMSALNYFVNGDTHEPGEETVPESGDDEVVIFEDILLLVFGCLRILFSQKFC
jgi:hypothetical protein